MRRTRHSRAGGREQALHELFSTSGLEAEPASRQVDSQFSLRPFAAATAGDGTMAPEPVPEGSPADQLYQRARDAAARGRRADAVQLYRDLLSLDPRHLGARNNLALLYEESGDADLALDELNAAVRFHPDQVDLLVNRGAIQGAMKRYNEAEADLRRALRLVPGHPGAQFNLGLVLWRKGLAEEAALAFRRAVELDAGNPAAWYYLGDALNQTGELADAVQALERASQLDPRSARPYNLMGRVLDRMNRPGDAIEMYRRARQADHP